MVSLLPPSLSVGSSYSSKEMARSRKQETYPPWASSKFDQQIHCVLWVLSLFHDEYLSVFNLIHSNLFINNNCNGCLIHSNLFINNIYNVQITTKNLEIGLNGEIQRYGVGTKRKCKILNKHRSIVIGDLPSLERDQIS